MAVICSFSSSSPPIQLHKSSSPITKTLMLNPSSRVPLENKKSSHILRVRSFNNKVFEDKSEGIVCYRNESGEIICEGLDEGPRLLKQPLKPTYNSRDSEIVNLLHQRLLQVINEGQLNTTQNGLASVQDDSN